MSDGAGATRAERVDRAFLGHPRGLAYLGFAEAWERFSYYGMQTLLVLYMTRQLLLPGHVGNIAGFGRFRAMLEGLYGHPLSTVALASAIFGLYSGTVYLMPIAGGALADRLWGRTRTITAGALLMAAGHFLMAFESCFLAALLLLLLGVGCFKGNIASQVGELYAPDDLRRADAFQIYFLFINAAVIIAPLVAGTLGEGYGWHYGFGAAGVGMLIGLLVYLAGRPSLPAEAPRSRAASRDGTPQRTLSSRERRAVTLLILLLPVMALGAVGNQEIFNAYLLWVPDHIDLAFFGQTLPTSWLIALDASVSVGSLFVAVAFWRWWARRQREPSEIWKMALGTAIGVLGQLCLVGAALASSDGHKAGIAWLLGFEIFNAIGFANVFPVGLALFARAAPKALTGTLIGVYYVHLFLCNNLVGWLGGLLERLPGPAFWGLHAALIGAAAAITALVAHFGGHLLAGADAPADP